MGQTVSIFGIRHHGPGSARSLREALNALQPDVVLVEGPPEANDLLHLVQHEAMRPPAAILIYSPEEMTATGGCLASYYPYAEFSPEWQAIRFGLARGIPVRMMDLAQAHQFAMMPRPTASEEVQPDAAPPPPLPEPEAEEAVQDASDESEVQEDTAARISGDPLLALAQAAGYSEGEQWWDHMVEQRRSAGDVFTAILEAMTALRESAPEENDPIAIRREAAMRQAIRGALAEGKQRVAVVCGAWHSPALLDLSNEKEDAALLRNLPKMQLQATWIPWTYDRLTRISGYGAGIDSPGWYEHLWMTERDVAVRWMINVARLLRGEDVDVSSAHVIEAVRLAETLAALRDRPLPGLPELNEAVLTVYCFGNVTPLRLIEQKLIVGERIGSVPPETPMAPLQADFERQARKLRMTVEASEKLLDLDLRKPNDLEKSRLLHRLALLGVGWGQNSGAALQTNAQGRGGTFHEIWRTRWQPEYAIQLIEAGQWGNTIAEAAASKVCHAADRAPDLASLTELVEDVLLAELPQAIQYLMRNLQAQAAVSSDTGHLMQALPPLAGVMRYGNVRQTDTEMIAHVVDGLVARICIGLGGACAALNEDAANEMFGRMIKVDEAIARMDEATWREPWIRALRGVAEQEGVHGLVAGRATRILLDQGIIDGAEAGRRLGLALSTASEPVQAAAWIEGFLRGSGSLLVHDSGLLGILDAWLNSLSTDIFHHLLPLLRRTFTTFARPERRAVGEKIRAGKAVTVHAQAGEQEEDFDAARAAAVLPLARKLLGME